MSYSIREVTTKIIDGNIRIPAFQRGFVWDSEEISFFIDSLFKGYPFGVIQLWRTKEALVSEKKFGPFELFEREEEYPIDYVLDGQQRLTSILGVFQTEIEPNINESNPFKIYFDITDMQESQFLYINEEDYDKLKYFPINVLFDSKKYRKATLGLPEQIVEKIDKLQTRFQEVRIPYQILETNEKDKVAIVFERINRKGQPLDTLQLLSAWTWSDDFDLKNKFEELKDELAPYGFNDLGENINLLLKIISAVLTEDASAESLMKINGSQVRTRFLEITNGIKGTIDFLRNNLHVEKIENLPSENLLVPLASFFSIQDNRQFQLSDNQRQILIRWFWKSSFAKRYSGGTTRQVNTDIKEILNLKKSNNSNLGNFSVKLEDSFFTQNIFQLGSVYTKTFILLLAQNEPKSFISGLKLTLKNVLVDYNRNQFHHIYPKKFLKNTNHNYKFSDSCLANFCFLNTTDNNQLGGNAPSIYKQKMPSDYDEILASAYCPGNIFLDDYNNFISARVKILKNAAEKLII
ncbi:DUF262 domain-containing protein [Leptospira mtsangambouensis]|uniref:GmrSD restriction endonuclease domain-containing protein n=1 Tax=Leptospira mtsangambouensis TaxID=2484912 RepID=UPI001EEC6AF0|nr:DUF262 domain-containing protein [Leptospira mtsangambouensis]MCG6142678.1 DUF262 domain-containing protein [Leptospira mtsangambouensis]